MAIQFLNNPKVGDNVKIELGDSSDLKIYHDPSIGSVIEESGAGDLFIDTSQAIKFRKAGSSELMALMTPDDSVDLYYDNAKKFETTSTGISVTNTGANAFIKINREDATTSGALFLQSSNGTNNINSNGVKDLKISTNNTERMRIDSSGNVGIGNTAPSAKLEVSGTVTISHETGSQTSPTTQLLFDNDNIDNGGGYNIDFKTSSNDTANRFMSRIQALRGSGAISSLGFFTDTGSALNRALLLDSSQNATFAGDVIVDGSVAVNTEPLFNRELLVKGEIAALAQDSGNNQLLLSASSTQTNISATYGGTGSYAPMQFETGGAVRVHLTASGNLGIGTTSATNKLTISDNSAQIALIDTSTSNIGEIQVGDADFTFNLDRSAAISSGKFAWRIDDTTRMELGLDAGDLGQLRLNEYGGGNITGTATQLLGVDENGYIIETSTSGGGTVTGSGVATRVAFWSGTSALSSDANLYWDNSNNRLGIGTASPSELLHVYHATTNTLAYLQSGDATTTLAMADNDGSTRIESDSGEFRFKIGGTASTAGSNTTEAMRITSGARVGIGLVSPSTRLHVRSGTENVVARFESTDTAATIQLKDTTGTVSIESRNDFRFSNSSGEKMRIDSSGNVGIGTTSPTSKLQTKLEATYSMGMSNEYVSTFVSKLQLGRVGVSSVSNIDFIYDIQGTEYGSIKRNYVNSSLKFERATNVDMIINGSGNVGIDTTAPGSKLQVGPGTNNSVRSPVASLGAATNGVLSALSLVNTSGNNVAGYGTSLDFHLAENYSPTGQIATVAENTTVLSALTFSTYSTALNERMRIKSTGKVRFNAYGQEDFTGTAAYLLAVESDGDIIEIGASDIPGGPYLPLAGGTMSGTGEIRTPDNFKLKVGTSGDMEIYHNATNTLIDNQTGNLLIQNSSGSVQINKGSTENMAEFITDGAVKLYYDSVKKFETTSTGVNVAGGIVFGDSHFIGDDGVDNLLIQGSAGENIIIDSADDIILDAGGDDIRLKVAGTEYAKFDNASSNLNITSSIQDKDIKFHGNDGGSAITALTLDMSDGGAAEFGARVYIPDYIAHVGDPNTLFGFNGNDTFVVNTNGSEKMRIDSAGNLGLGTTSPTNGGGNGSWLSLNAVTSSPYSGGIAYTIANAIKAYHYVESGYLRHQAQSGVGHRFTVNGTTDAMYMTSAGNVGIGTDTPSALLEIQTVAISGSQDFQIFSRGESTNYEVLKISRSAGSAELLAFQNLTLSADYSATQTGTNSNIVFKTDNTERMRIDSAGNVLINATSKFNAYPASFVTQTIASSSGDTCPILELVGNRSAAFGNQNGMIQFFNKTSTAVEVGRISSIQGSATNSGQINFMTSDAGTLAERIRITSAGNVGIGTTSPDTKLELLSTAASSDRTIPHNVLTITAENANLPYTGFGGSIIFKNRSYSYGLLNSARIRSVIDSDSSSNRGAGLAFDVTNSSQTYNTSLFLKYDGNVGIGQDTPSNSLDVYRATGDASIRIQAETAANSTILKFRNSNADADITVDYTTSNQARMVFTTDNSGGYVPVLSLEANRDTLMYGNVGIGTTAPAELLNVNKENAESVVLISRGGNNVSTSTDIGKIKFSADYNGSIVEYGNIKTYSNSLSAVRGSMDFNVKSTAGNIITGMTVYGTSSGVNVGIGTDSPTRQLQINNSAAAATSLRLTNGAASISTGGDFGLSSGGDLAVWHNDNLGILFGTNNTERMRIDNAGNVGIGTTNPGHKLAVNGTFKYGSALEQAGAVSGSEPENAPDFTPDAYLDIKVDGTDYLIPLFTKQT